MEEYAELELGLATTRQLLKELEARLDVSATIDDTDVRARTALYHVRRAYSALDDRHLSYKTVDTGEHDVIECNRPAHQDGHHGPACYGIQMRREETHE
jgi:hypothetical protein